MTVIVDAPNCGTASNNHAQRIREGLAAAKARGVKLGGLRPGTLKENARAKQAAADRSEALRPILAPLAAEGASFGAMAQALYDAGTRTAKLLVEPSYHPCRHRPQNRPAPAAPC